MSVSVHQTSYALLREELRGVVLQAAADERTAYDDTGSIEGRASAALYALLGDHPIDRRGRCRSCGGPRGVLSCRRRVCRVLVAARFYLQQPVDVLLGDLAGAVEPGAAPVGYGGHGVEDPWDPAATEVLAKVEGEPSDPRTQPLQIPAPIHGRAGVNSSPNLRPGRAPRDGHAPLSGVKSSLVGAGCAP